MKILGNDPAWCWSPLAVVAFHIGCCQWELDCILNLMVFCKSNELYVYLALSSSWESAATHWDTGMSSGPWESCPCSNAV